jgi:hypothetical protein
VTTACGRCYPSTGDTGDVLLQPVIAARGRCSPPSSDGGSWAAVGGRATAMEAATTGSGDGGRVGRGGTTENDVCGQVGCEHCRIGFILSTTVKRSARK